MQTDANDANYNYNDIYTYTYNSIYSYNHNSNNNPSLDPGAEKPSVADGL
ncbi:hypothetical protein [Pseudoflavonifractor sp. An85]|nr:hypothetical protein [Pseudoflavonifractor sp. An85]